MSLLLPSTGAQVRTTAAQLSAVGPDSALDGADSASTVVAAPAVEEASGEADVTAGKSEALTAATGAAPEGGAGVGTGPVTDAALPL